ncbi:hypothetical protein CJ030_MR1G001683 [Morella rubra]|uniref:Uncharacterized protein n=1 Tax=Morella rubra TaxID=262757 RepID=A0A6A1WRD6_9ROSI|nr:hypothetical protein CJ030_MR1G001683 [Morella rubra]
MRFHCRRRQVGFRLSSSQPTIARISSRTSLPRLMQRCSLSLTASVRCYMVTFKEEIFSCIATGTKEEFSVSFPVSTPLLFLRWSNFLPPLSPIILASCTDYTLEGNYSRIATPVSLWRPKDWLIWSREFKIRSHKELRLMLHDFLVACCGNIYS